MWLFIPFIVFSCFSVGFIFAQGDGEVRVEYQSYIAELQESRDTVQQSIEQKQAEADRLKYSLKSSFAGFFKKPEKIYSTY